MYLGEITKDKVICWLDFETENLALNKCSNHPWQCAAILARNGKVLDSFDLLIKWPFKLNVSEGAAIITRFDNGNVEKFGVSPQEVHARLVEFMNRADYIAGHNILGFDAYMLQSLCETLGEPVYNFVPKALDTACIAKGIKYEVFPEKSENFLSYQYKMYHYPRKRSIKYNLSALGKEFNIDHDYDNLHNAIVDLQLNMKVYDKLSYMIDFPE